MLTSLTLQNFKSHLHSVTKLEPLTILVGANASGKSSILEALSWSAHTSNEGVPVKNANLDGSRRVNSERLQVRIEAEPSFVYDWTYPVEGTKGSKSQHLISSGHKMARLIRAAQLIQLDFSKLASPTPISSEPPNLSSNGQNLAGVLAHLRLANDETFESIVASLRDVVPSFRKVRIQRTMIHQGDKSVAADQLFLDFIGAPSIPASEVSEGTLIALGLLTLIQEPGGPRLILIDEIDRGLHPKAQVDLLRTIRKMIDTIKGLQIIATTHSPFVVDAVAPESVRVLALKPDGTTAVKALTDHPDASKALEVLTAGELWSAEGEDWVVQPKTET